MSVKSSYAALIAGFLLQACGQTGPLYLPDKPPPIYVPLAERETPETKEQEEPPAVLEDQEAIPLEDQVLEEDSIEEQELNREED